MSALALCRQHPGRPSPPGVDAAVSRGVRWLEAASDGGRRTPATPIGLYFARLWYSEALYPRIFTLAALAAAAALPATRAD